jgi:hypothetical protein
MPTAEVITQRELKQYRELSDEARQVTASQEALRKALIARMEDGAEIQPGKLTANLAKSEAQRFSFDALVRILGLKKAEEIKLQLPVTASVSLKVIEIN